jgi:hypothetical protein
MNIVVESKLEYMEKHDILQDNNEIDNDKIREIDDTLNDNILNENIVNWSDISQIVYDENIIDDILINTNDIKSNTHLYFTNILSNQNINKSRKEYEKWMNDNSETLLNAFYIISNKYFNENIKINFKTFSQFCYLYN